MINMIRNPVERFISHFNYRRNGDMSSQGKMASKVEIDKEVRNSKSQFIGANPCSKVTLQECIMKNMYECNSQHASYMIPFFCGQGTSFTVVGLPKIRMITRTTDPACQRADLYAFEMALKNMLKYYFLVGITEQFDDVVTLLERLIPYYFTGLTGNWKVLG